MSVLLGFLAIVLSGCAAPSSSLDTAQRQVPFRILVPRCLPERVDPKPVIGVLPIEQSPGPPAIEIAFWYRDQSTAPARSSSAVSLTEGEEPPNGPLIEVVGKHEVLNGHDVVLSTPPAYPGLDWTEGTVQFSMATTLTWDEALRVYRSLVDPAYQCT